MFLMFPFWMKRSSEGVQTVRVQFEDERAESS